MATKADRRCVLEWPCCDRRLLKLATSTKKENFGCEKDLKYDFPPSDGPGRNKVTTPGG